MLATSSPVCRCGHSWGFHHGRAGRCHDWDCKCGRFRRVRPYQRVRLRRVLGVR